MVKAHPGFVALAVVVALAPVPVLAQEPRREVRLAEILLDHGVPEAALAIAERELAGRPEGARIKARALALRAKPEKPRFMPSQEELDLVLELRSMGRIGWAEAVLDAALAGDAFAKDELRVARTIRARLHGDRSAMGEPGEAKKRRESYDRAKEILESILSDAQAPAEAVSEARRTLYEIVTARGEALLEVSRRTDEPDSARAEALEAFSSGEELLEAERRKLEPAGDDGTACLARWSLARCTIGHARSLPSTEKEKRASLLKKGVDLLSDVSLDLGGTLETYEVALDVWAASRDLGDEANANVALDTALDVEKLSPDFDPLRAPHGQKKPLALDDASLEIFARASLAKAGLLLAKRSWKEELAVLDRVLADARVPFPGSMRKDFGASYLGLRLRIERARPLKELGRSKEAVSELEKIAAEDPLGPLGERAKRVRRELEENGAAQASETSFGEEARLMEEALGRNAHAVALRHGLLALELARREKPEQADEAKARALHGVGRAYRGLGRWNEAAVALEEVARRHVRSPRAEDAALEWLACLEKLVSVNSGRDRQAYEAALRYVAATFRGTGEAVAAFFLGNELRDEERYREAAEAYDRVGPEAPAIQGEALYLGAVCRYLLAQRSKLAPKDARDDLLAAAARLKKVLDLPRKPGDDSRRNDLESRARFLLAEVLLGEAVDDPRGVLALFEKPEPRADRDSAARAALFRILAHVRLAEPALAETELASLLDDAQVRSQKRTILAARAVAAALDEQTSADPSLSPEDRRKTRVRAGRYYAHGILAGLEPGSDAAPTAREAWRTADRLLALGLDVAGLDSTTFVSDVDPGRDLGAGKPLLQRAREIYSLLAKPDPRLQGVEKLPAPEHWRILAGLGEAAGLLGEWTASRDALERLVAETKLLGADSRLDARVASANGTLVLCYQDLGRAQVELGLQGDAADFEKGRRVFDDLVSATREASPPWWRVKLACYRALERRGTHADFAELACALRAVRRKYPDLHGAGDIARELDRIEKALVAKGFKLDGP